MTSGMNVGEVRQLAQQLTRGAEQLRSLVSSIDGRVHASSWLGRDADTFKQQWWPQHRQAVLSVAEAVEGLGRSASNNADDQERVSSAGGSGAAAASAGAGPGWLGAAGGALATGGVLAGQLGTGLQDQLQWLEHAKGFADMTDWKFFDDANAPVKGFVGDILKDGRIKFVGGAMNVVTLGADGYQVYQDYQQGDYLEMGLDTADTGGDAVQAFVPGPVGYLGGVAVHVWTDVGRDAAQVDWNLTDDTYAQYMNPFVVKNWTQTILPGAADGLKQGGSQIFEDLLP